MVKVTGFMDRAHKNDLNLCPRNQGITFDASMRSIGAAFLSEILVFMSPTTPAKEVWVGVVVLVLAFIISIVASYGLLRKCEFRSGFGESVMSFAIALVIAIVFGLLWSQHAIADVMNYQYFFTSDMLVAWMVGGFLGSIIK